MASSEMRRWNPARGNWPEKLVVALFAAVTVLVLLPSRPAPQDAVPVSNVQPHPVPAKSVDAKITLSQMHPDPTTVDAVRIRVRGMPGTADLLLQAAVDGSTVMASVSSQNPESRSFDVDIPIRFVLPGKHAVSLTAEATGGDTRYTGSGQIIATVDQSPVVANPRVAPRSSGILWSVDAITDGRETHVVAAGRPDHGALLKFAAGRALAMEGWAAAATHTPAAAVLFRVDNGPMRRAALGDDRPDVANAFAASGLEYAGFTARLSTSGLRPGQHHIAVFVVPAVGAPAEPAGGAIRFALPGA